ncbi:MAG: hypothetical protein AAGA53_07265 [Pseudomonadota bacterium]
MEDSTHAVTTDFALQLGDVPRRENLFVNHEKAQTLHDRLDIAPPGDLESAPPLLSFNRSRRVNIKWKSIVNSLIGGDTVQSSANALREYFEKSWWGYEEPKPDEIIAFLSLHKDELFYFLDKTEPPAPAPDKDEKGKPEAPEEEKIGFFAANADPDAETGVELSQGFFLRHGLSGRVYLIQTIGDLQGTVEDFFLSEESYDSFWNEQVQSIELVFETAKDAQTFGTAYSALDVRAPFIIQRYKELETLATLAKMLDGFASETIGDAIKARIGSGFELEGLEDLQARYRNIKLAPYNIENDFKRLKRQAAEMNYVLMLDGETAGKFPDGTDRVATPGNLYKINKRTFTSTVKHPKPAIQFVGEVLAFGFGILRPVSTLLKNKGRPPKIPKTYSIDPPKKNVDHYDLVDPTINLLENRVQTLREEGKEVFVFEESSSGFVTEDGTPIEEIMDRCAFSEEFRRRCVVMVPEYDYSLTGRKVVAKYHIYKYPLPGIVSTRLPSMFIRESLSFRTVWKNTELGELSSSINLAPGEEREITITRSFQKETTSTETRTSVFELSSSESTDLADEMESVARNENDLKTHAGGSSKKTEDKKREAKAGFSSPASPWNASGGFENKNSLEENSDWSSDHSIKSFNSSMNKVARKAARSINQKNKQEVTSTKTEKTTVSNTDSTNIKISNINQGRTLNLMFYKVYNRYTGGLYMEDLKLQVRSGVEIIAGSGLYPNREFDLSEVDAVLEEFDQTPLPIPMSQEQKAAYHLNLLTTLDKMLEHEYESADITDPEEGVGPPPGKTSGPDANGLQSRGSPVTFGRKWFESSWKDQAQVSVKNREMVLMSADSDPVAELEEEKRKLEALYSRLTVSNISLDEEDLLVTSPGFYLDSILGVRAGTEPYSEEMRIQEIRMRAAEVAETEANAVYKLAQSQRIASTGTMKAQAASSNSIIGVVPSEDYKSLTVRLKFPLGPGDWRLCLDGKPVENGTLTKAMQTRTVFVISWKRGSSTHWMEADDISTRLSLIDNKTDEIVG